MGIFSGAIYDKLTNRVIFRIFARTNPVTCGVLFYLSHLDF